MEGGCARCRWDDRERNRNEDRRKTVTVPYCFLREETGANARKAAAPAAGRPTEKETGMKTGKKRLPSPIVPIVLLFYCSPYGLQLDYKVSHIRLYACSSAQNGSTNGWDRHLAPGGSFYGVQGEITVFENYEYDYWYHEPQE